MKKYFFILVIFVVITVFSFAKEPAAPKGFSWFKDEAFKGAVLKPEGWNTDVKNYEKLVIISVADSEISENLDYKTGLSIIIAKNEDPNASIEDIIAHQKEALASKNPEAKVTDVKRGKYIGFEIKTEYEARDTIYFLILGKKDSDLIYMISFKSPVFGFTEQWEKFGKIMTTNIILDE